MLGIPINDVIFADEDEQPEKDKAENYEGC